MSCEIIEIGHFESHLPLIFFIHVTVGREAHVLVENSLKADVPDCAEDVESGDENAIDRLVTRPAVHEVHTVLGHRVDHTLVEAPKYEVV